MGLSECVYTLGGGQAVKHRNPRKILLVMSAMAALLALLVLAGCDSDDGDNDDLRMERDAALEESAAARQEATALRQQLDAARQALVDAEAIVTELESALEMAAEASNAQVAELTMQLEMATEERDDAQAAVDALVAGDNLYKITVTNGLDEELFAPIVVTDAMNDHLLFDGDNYVSDAAEHQILTGDPAMVVAAIMEGDAAVGHGSAGPPGVLLPAGESVTIRFATSAAALRILAMVAPTRYPDHFVSAVADAPMDETVTVPLSRFDIGHDEDTMSVRLFAENAGTVTIEHLAGTADADADMAEAVAYDVMVTNGLSEEPLAPIVVTRVNDEHYLFDGAYVTDAAEHQILTGDPAMVVAEIMEGDAAVGHGTAGPPGVLLPPGESVTIMFETDATGLRILAMVAPTMVPDNYVSAVVNVASLGMSGDSVTAPLTRFDIGHDEMTMDISLVDDDMTVGTVMITRR